MAYPNRFGEVENYMTRPFRNPFSDPVINALNEARLREDLEDACMFGDDRWNYMEKYCKAHLQDYLNWVWEHREKED
jgi:phage gp16-like protein